MASENFVISCQTNIRTGVRACHGRVRIDLTYEGIPSLQTSHSQRLSLQSLRSAACPHVVTRLTDKRSNGRTRFGTRRGSAGLVVTDSQHTVEVSKYLTRPLDWATLAVTIHTA